MQHDPNLFPSPAASGVSRRGFLAAVTGVAAAMAVSADSAAASGPGRAFVPRADMALAAIDLDAIQGNVLPGFDVQHQALVFVAFPDSAAGRAWIAALQPMVTAGSQVAGASGAMVNLAFTHAGLSALGLPSADLGSFPDAFREGMRRRADLLGDRGESDPASWPQVYRQSSHAVVIVAAHDVAAIDGAVEVQRRLAIAHRVEVVHVQRGDARADQPGHEHFGFRDGISQPGVRGFTPRQNPADPNQGVPGQDLLWPGEFLLGYARQAGVGGGEEPGPAARSGPVWTVNGSYLVMRRLRQDVAGFRAFMAETATAQGISEDLAGAKLMGRYKSGVALASVGEHAVDPGTTDPDLLAPNRLLDFELAEDDPDGETTPHAAHIRKMYPRDQPTDDGGEEDTQTHRLLRRGIPFGGSLPEGVAATDPLARAAFPDDRGLLFLCYQTSIERQFEFVQRRWANDPDFPVEGAGTDPVIGRPRRGGSFSLPGGRPDHVALMQRFVHTTGGDYFFQPSLTALALLAAVTPDRTQPATTPPPVSPRQRPRRVRPPRAGGRGEGPANRRGD